jgi:hypothetical protein
MSTSTKTIGVQVRFFTNDITDEPGTLLKRNAWCAGMVRVQSNPLHGISHTTEHSFRSVWELLSAILNALKDARVKLHHERIGSGADAEVWATADDLDVVKITPDAKRGRRLSVVKP